MVRDRYAVCVNILVDGKTVGGASPKEIFVIIDRAAGLGLGSERRSLKASSGSCTVSDMKCVRACSQVLGPPEGLWPMPSQRASALERPKIGFAYHRRSYSWAGNRFVVSI